jgi:hypothetical protein
LASADRRLARKGVQALVDAKPSPMTPPGVDPSRQTRSYFRRGALIRPRCG